MEKFAFPIGSIIVASSTLLITLIYQILSNQNDILQHTTFLATLIGYIYILIDSGQNFSNAVSIYIILIFLFGKFLL